MLSIFPSLALDLLAYIIELGISPFEILKIVLPLCCDCLIPRVKFETQFLHLPLLLLGISESDDDIEEGYSLFRNGHLKIEISALPASYPLTICVLSGKSTVRSAQPRCRCGFRPLEETSYLLCSVPFMSIDVDDFWRTLDGMGCDWWKVLYQGGFCSLVIGIPLTRIGIPLSCPFVLDKFYPDSVSSYACLGEVDVGDVAVSFDSAVHRDHAVVPADSLNSIPADYVSAGHVLVPADSDRIC
ncbi:hypothetical protein Tco_0329370 [Tanacetum coccineum]